MIDTFTSAELNDIRRLISEKIMELIDDEADPDAVLLRRFLKTLPRQGERVTSELWQESRAQYAALCERGHERVRGWCAGAGVKCDGDAFGAAFSHVPEDKIASMDSMVFAAICQRTATLYDLWNTTESSTHRA